MSNKYYFRHIDAQLLEWKNDTHRKPLLVRGARQVGKSSAIRHLGETFKYFIEVNLERRKDLKTLFGDNIDVKKICVQLSAIYAKPIIPNETLLFIDEIQESERAISALRYFYEDYPELHVVAAGSLLEFALNELPSFGVGRIRSLYMYPFSFDEYLAAQGFTSLIEYRNSVAEHGGALPEAMHTQLTEQLRSYYLVGGMPEAVSVWADSHDYNQCSRVHNDILDTYQDDFSKYKSRISPLVLSNTLKSIAVQAGSKFIYSRVEGDNASNSVKEALSLLTLAGLAFPVTHTAANGQPLGAEVNIKFCKFLFIDIGLMQSMLGINASETLLSSNADFTNKGGLSEMFVGLELIKYSSPYRKPEVYYWQKTDNKGQAEVDYLAIIQGNVIPIEVKSGTRGSMQSMYQFLKTKHSDYGIRASLEPFGRYDNVKVVPLYAIHTIKNE